MRTYTDFNAWKVACRNRGWIGPSLISEEPFPSRNFQFTDAGAAQRATWDSATNSGVILDETPL